MSPDETSSREEQQQEQQENWSTECNTCIMGHVEGLDEETARELSGNHKRSNPDHDAYIEDPDGNRVELNEEDYERKW